MCALLAASFHEQLLECGATAKTRALHSEDSVLNLARAASIAVGNQLRGKRVPALVPQHASLHQVIVPAALLPMRGCLRQNAPFLNHGLRPKSAWPGNHRGLLSKPLSATILEHLNVQCLSCFAAPSKANLRDGYVAVGQDRTAELRKWLLRKQELMDAGEDDPSSFPKHCQKLLAGKSRDSNFGDVKIAATMRKGFSLMGQIPESGVLPTRVSLLSLRPEEGRNSSVVGNMP